MLDYDNDNDNDNEQRRSPIVLVGMLGHGHGHGHGWEWDRRLDPDAPGQQAFDVPGALKLGCVQVLAREIHEDRLRRINPGVRPLSTSFPARP